MYKKKSAVTGNETTGATPSTGSTWVDNMFGFLNPKIQNNPKFKELSKGAQSLANAIIEIIPPGEQQKLALDTLSSTMLHAAQGFVRHQAVGAAV